MQFAINGLHTQIKRCVLSKQPLTFQQLRHVVDIERQELECDFKQELDIQAQPLQTKETFRNEISALSIQNPPKTQFQHKKSKTIKAAYNTNHKPTRSYLLSQILAKEHLNLERNKSINFTADMSTVHVHHRKL